MATALDVPRSQFEWRGQEFSRDELVELSKKRTIKAPKPGIWVVTVLTILVVIGLIVSVVGNPRVGYAQIAHWFFSGQILQGLWLTLWLTAVVTVLSLIIGAVLAAMRLSGQPVLVAIAWGYTWIFRSIPLLVLLLLWFNIAYLFPVIHIGIPWMAEFTEFKTVSIVSAIAAAIIALTMHESAPAAEIIRGGLLSIDEGQKEASFALALSPARTFFRILIPQAMRTIIPAAGSLLIGILKSTAMVSTIAVTDLLYSVQIIYNRNFEVMPLLFVACLWYLIVTSILSIGQYYLERHFARGSSRNTRVDNTLREEQASA